VTYTDGNNQTVTGTLAYGRLFRGERLWNTPATELYNLGINKQYDVGDPSEYANDTKLSDYKWDPVVHYNFDYNSGDENNASSNYMKAWTAVTDIMTDITSANDPKNIYFHCRVGADRTGTTAYLLEGLLGVPDEARYEEYELTNLSGLYDRTRYYKQKSSTNNLKFVFMMEYVKTNADILNWYMSNPNSDMNLVQAFRSAMTVQSSAPSNNNQNNIAPLNLTNSMNNANNVLNDDNNNESGNDSNQDFVSNYHNVGDGYVAPLGVSNYNESPASIGLMTAGILAALAGRVYLMHYQKKKTQNNMI
jgi:protein-tyrosine phosphatase